MNLGLVSQPAELRCLSDKLSAVNIECRCQESGRESSEAARSCGEAGGGWGEPGGGSHRLGARHLPSLRRLSLLMAKLKPFSCPNPSGRRVETDKGEP